MAYRVAVVYGTDFGSFPGGGIHNLIVTLGQRAPDSVRVEYMGVGPLAGELPRPQDSFVPVLQSAVPARMPANLRFVRGLAATPRDWTRYQAIVLHRAEHVFGLPRGSGPKLVQVVHGGTWFAWHGGKRIFGLLYPGIEAMAATRAATFLTVSAHHAHLTKKAARRMYRLPVTFDPVFSTVVRCLPRASLPSLTVVGRLSREKRIDRALVVAQRLAWPLHIFGSGPLLAELRQRAKSLEVSCHFHGYVTQSQLAHWYATQATVLVQTSSFEGMSLAVLEAAAAGVPIAALSAPGVTEATEAVGGRLAQTMTDFPGVIRDALEEGNRRSADWVRDTYGPERVAEVFWRHVIDVAASQSREL